jgi:hypothetical protein
MKLYELFGDWLLALPIVEQARSRDVLENRICDDGYQIITHLVKIYSWNNPQDFANHVKDINGWLGPIYRLKLKGNKYPKARDYYNWLMECTDDDASFVTDTNRGIDYDVPRSDKSDAEVFEIIKTIIRNISNDMANKKFTHAKDYMI